MSAVVCAIWENISLEIEGVPRHMSSNIILMRWIRCHNFWCKWICHLTSSSISPCRFHRIRHTGSIYTIVSSHIRTNSVTKFQMLMQHMHQASNRKISVDSFYVTFNLSFLLTLLENLIIQLSPYGLTSVNLVTSLVRMGWNLVHYACDMALVLCHNIVIIIRLIKR